MKSGATTLKNTWKNSELVKRLPFSLSGSCDRLLLFTALSIAAFGLVMVYSASYIFSQEKFGDGLYYFNRHLLFLGAGLAMMSFCRFLDYRVWQKLSLPIFLACIGLMMAVLVPGIGHKAGGARRWISFGGFTIQPVEFAKVGLLIFLSARLSRKEMNFEKISFRFLLELWPAVLMILLCLLEPDFGSSALVLTITGVLVYLAGLRLRYLLGAVGAVLPLFAGLMILAPYRRARLLTYLNPWADPQGAGFQIIQSFLAFYRGGLFGVGLGNSKAKIFYLPEAHNDFILSVVGDELGFLGIGLLILAFLFLLFRGVRVSAKCNDRFGALLASGLTLMLGFEVFWNAAIVLGLFPNKGMNLPFISSGGSSIICAMTIMGILLNISAQSKLERSA